MRYFFLFLLVLSSCKPDTSEQETVVEVIDYSTMNLKSSEINLVGNAQQNALNWQDYQNLITGFENYDHTVGSTTLLIDYIDKMLLEPDENFNKQSILSRIIVLKTRLSIYKSYLKYRVKKNIKLEEKYNNIILALDELNDQMNWTINDFDAENKKLLEDLKADLDPKQEE